LSSSPNSKSPAALYTETTSPLPSPPQSLLVDPVLSSSIRSLRDAIKVETPFNVDRFKSLLVDHPNPPFIELVMKGLREGFWPCDESKWKVELEEISDNYKMDDADLQALREF
jgi:hypothetical protein